jgi:hypothetical protein
MSRSMRDPEARVMKGLFLAMGVLAAASVGLSLPDPPLPPPPAPSPPPPVSVPNSSQAQTGNQSCEPEASKPG